MKDNASLKTIRKGSMAQQHTYAYNIKGGQPVVGEIRCLGAKNFTTKAMVAALLGDTPTILTNVPPIGDVIITSEMLTSIGVKVELIDHGRMCIDASSIQETHVPTPHSGSNRVPILMLGALLHRFKTVSVPFVGGDQIGLRSVDFHLGAIEQFGGKVETTDHGFVASRNGGLKGTHIKLPYPSVGATETCLYLGVLAEGRTTISNAAIEPEVFELITMLRAMGAIIFTSSGRDIRIEGAKRLTGTNMKAMGDRIEAASWACLACASDGDITVRGIRPETVHENRFGYLKELDRLGAKTQLTTHCLGGVTCRYRESSYDHSAIIIGPTPFTAVDQIATPDLRAGLAYVIAAAVARGTTMVTGIDLLARGYGNIVPRLAAMNLDIERIPIDS